jgi:hypothetical protein
LQLLDAGVVLGSARRDDRTRPLLQAARGAAYPVGPGIYFRRLRRGADN